jgi:hypothetical protein
MCENLLLVLREKLKNKVSDHTFWCIRSVQTEREQLPVLLAKPTRNWRRLYGPGLAKPPSNRVLVRREQVAVKG